MNFSHPAHKPVFLDEVIATASDEILELCGENAECIFDAIQTGSHDIALDTLETDITNTNDQMITGKLGDQFLIALAMLILSNRSSPPV